MFSNNKNCTPPAVFQTILVSIRAVPFVGKVYNLKVKSSDRNIVGKDGVMVRDYRRPGLSQTVVGVFK